MKTAADPRHQSRIIALQKLFEQEFKSNSPFEITELKRINQAEDESIQIDEKFAMNLVNGVLANKEKIDSNIKDFAKKRPFEDTSKVDLLILRIAIYELLFSDNKTPSKVIIDESIELAKTFGGDKSFTFVNGILGSISNKLDK